MSRNPVIYCVGLHLAYYRQMTREGLQQKKKYIKTKTSHNGFLLLMEPWKNRGKEIAHEQARLGTF